nr:MarR family transcriptional regulator [uncultured Mucilaginibacter sp.]
MNKTPATGISTSQFGRQFSDSTILMHEAIARKAGLSGTDHKYLGFIIQHGSMTAGELAKYTGLTTGTVTGLIDRFEKKNFVSREFDKSDRRKVIIVPNTPVIMKELGGIFGEIETKMTDLLNSYSKKDLALIENYMQSAIQIMQEITRKLNDTK